MLIIEIDGITHDTESLAVKDKRREEELTDAGFRVIRFTDDDVLKNMNGVVAEIEKVIDNIRAATPLIPRPRGTKEEK